MDLKNNHFNHDSSEAGRHILSRARNNLKSALWKSGAIRQALAPEVARDIIDFRSVASRIVPHDYALRRRVMEALQEVTDWALDLDVLTPAVARWLKQELEACLKEIWTSRLRIKIRVTRNEISVVSIDGRFSPNVGSLP